MARERQRPHPEIDLRMRHEGFVTAQEVADAMGMHDANGVRKAIAAGRIPGKSVEGLGVYRRWYVDIRAMLAGYPLGDAPAETRRALRALVKLVEIEQE